ncbi:MAG: DUF3352 domain-containing protein [Fuerstiella sp.]
MLCSIRRFGLIFAALATAPLATATVHAQDTLPFSYSVESFRHESDDVSAFVVRLRQPFLAEEFEKSNYIRMKATDENAFLIYPSETRFEQRHAEFYGRLKGDGEAEVELSYEVVSENADGSRRIDSRAAKVKIKIPTTPTGSEAIYQSWAEKQNQHFAKLLEYYPDETFFEFLLLQSKSRYGITPPRLAALKSDSDRLEEEVYHLFSGGLQVQRSLQRSTLSGATVSAELTNHIKDVRAPSIKSANYAALLKTLQEDGDAKPKLHPTSGLIPEDQYLVHFNSWDAIAKLRQSNQQWLEPLYRIMTEDSRDHHLIAKYEAQLGIRMQDLEKWFSKDQLTSLTVTGSDLYAAEGTDITLILSTPDSKPIINRLQSWITAQKQHDANAEDRTFNYRGVQIQARYTPSRTLSSFAVLNEGSLIISNSHVGIRRIVDTIQGRLPSLAECHDYKYVTALHPPTDAADDGYVYASDAFLRYLFSPAFKIAERRRKESMNHLVMLNNASLFWRLEYGTTPENLEQLIEGRFIGRNQLVCPQGGAYSFDAATDSSVNSVFNRIKYLTPIRELDVLRISNKEAQEYGRYRQRYERLWKDYFSPMAFRFSTAQSLQVDYCFLPFQNSKSWSSMRSQLASSKRGPIKLQQPAKSTIARIDVGTSESMIRDFVRDLPGVAPVLEDDPTLTDLQWLGDRASLNFSDTHSILEIDPLRLKPQSFPLPLTSMQQTILAAIIYGTDAPAYLAIDVDDPDKSERFLQMLTTRVFLHKSGSLGPLESELDSYRLPNYKEHSISVVTYRLYALRLRLYLAAVGDQLIIATESGLLREVIDASLLNAKPRTVEGQLAVQIHPQAMREFREDLRVYWEEHARIASHNNIMPIYTLLNLYAVPIDQVDSLSDAKYGVTYFCPDGEYVYNDATQQVTSTVYGNRQNALQEPPQNKLSSFAKAFDAVSNILFTLNFSDNKITGQFLIDTSANQQASPKRQ